MEGPPLLKEIGEEEEPSDRPRQEMVVGVQVFPAFSGGWGWRNGTDGGLKHCNLFVVSKGGLVFRENLLECLF